MKRNIGLLWWLNSWIANRDDLLYDLRKHQFWLFCFNLPAAFIVYILLSLLLVRSVNKFRLVLGPFIFLFITQKIFLDGFPLLECKAIIDLIIFLMHDSDVDERL